MYPIDGGMLGCVAEPWSEAEIELLRDVSLSLEHFWTEIPEDVLLFLGGGGDAEWQVKK